VLELLQPFGLGDIHAAVLGLPVVSVASETPCLRARSAVFAPASCSFSTPMICSSVNRARFICPSLFQGRTLNPRGGKSQWQVTVGQRSLSAQLRYPPCDSQCPL